MAELVGLALLLNRTVLLPSGTGARFGGLEAVLDLPSLDAAGVRRVPAAAARVCAGCQGIYRRQRRFEDDPGVHGAGIIAGRICQRSLSFPDSLVTCRVILD